MDYRAEIKLKNNRILHLIEDAGYESVAEFCRKHNLHYNSTVNLIGIKEPAFNARGEYRKLVIDIATALRRMPEDLFTPTQAVAGLKPKAMRVLSEDEALSLADPDAGKIMIPSHEREVENKLITDKLLGTLPERQRDVLERRFGIGRSEETLEEIGDYYNITGMRVRQIEARALRKLKFHAHKQLHLATSD